MENRKIRIGITQGDYNGVGPEVVLKAVSDEQVPELYTPVIFADWRLLDRAARELEINVPTLKRVKSCAEVQDGCVNVVDLRLGNLEVTPGQPSVQSGAGALTSLEASVNAVTTGEVDLIVTAPISKEAIQSDSFHFPGHTEYLNDKAGADYRATMILFDDKIRVALVTTHLPLGEVSAHITKESVLGTIKDFHNALRRDFGILRPRIAVLSLNPHSGDGGLLGNEEQTAITPAIDEAFEEGILAFGPYAVDGFFGSAGYAEFDGIVAMYHDQGLAPFKALARENGVNFTAGLPFVRTSPDHGTACDIAWKGVADAASMREAIYKGVDILRYRKNHDTASANPLHKAPVERHKSKDLNADKIITEKSGEER